MLAFSIDYYGIFFRATQSVELFCTYHRRPSKTLFTEKVSHSQVIRLEIGALAAWTPAKTAQIEPYAAEYYPKIYSLSL